MSRLGEWTRTHRSDLLAVAVLAIMPPLVFWQGLVNPAGLANEDAADYYQPYYTFAANEVQAGRFPAWNPYNLMGIPYHASLQGALFYPLRWPLFWIPYLQGYAITLMVHYFLGAVATYLLMRIALKVGPLAALLGSMGVAFGGFFMGHMSHLNYVQAYPWLMACILLIWLAVQRQQWRWAVWAGGCIGLLALIGSVHLLLILGVLFGTFVLYHTILAGVDLLRGSRDWVKLVRPGGSVLIALVLGAAIGAVQLLPSYALYKTSARGQEFGWERITLGSAHPIGNSVQMVVPFYYGNSRLGYWNEYNYQDMAHYAGIVVVLGAVVGLTCIGRDRHLWFLVVLAAVGFLVSAGKYLPVYKLLYEMGVPGFKQLRCPTRIYWLTELALACLAAVGIERALVRPVQDGRLRWRRRLGVAAGVGVILVVGVAMWRLHEYANDPKEPVSKDLLFQAAFNPNIPDGELRSMLPALVYEVNKNPSIFADKWKVYRLAGASDLPRRVVKEHDPACWGNVLAAVASAVLVPVLVLRGRPIGRMGAVGLVVVLALDLYCLSFGMVQYERAIDGGRLMAPTVGTPPEARWLQERLGIQRYAVLSKPLTYPTPNDEIVPNRGMQFDLRYVEGRGGGIIDSPARSQFCGVGGMIRPGMKPELVSLILKLDGVLGVRYIFSEYPLQHSQLTQVWQDRRYWVYQNQACLPMAFFVRNVLSVPSGEQALRAMVSEGFDPRQVAFVTQRPPEETANSPAKVANVREVKAVPGRWEIQTETDAPAQLVISEGFDAGWQCRIDDSPTPVYQTDDQLMSVPVPAGSRRVVLEYVPPGLRSGAVVSALAVLVCLGAPFGRRWMERRKLVSGGAGVPGAEAQSARPIPGKPDIAKPTSGKHRKRRRR